MAELGASLNGKTAFDLSPLSYLQVRQCIDGERLKRLQSEPPSDDPSRAVESSVVAHSRDLGYRDLLVWEQVTQGEELYIPPSHCYDVYVRLSTTSPVVQWRDGVLDVRQPVTGEIVVAPPYRAMYFRTFGHGLNLHLSITPELLCRAVGADGCGPMTRLRNCFGERDAVVAAIARALLAYTKAPGNRPREFLESMGMSLAVRLLERFGTHESVEKGRLSSSQIARIDEFLSAHLDGKISLQFLADLVSFPSYTFYRAFKASLGVSPMYYVSRERMRRARTQVEGTRKPIGDIATEVGFVDLAHFTNTFRKYWGVAPTKLRALHAASVVS